MVGMHFCMSKAKKNPFLDKNLSQFMGVSVFVARRYAFWLEICRNTLCFSTGFGF